MEQYNDSADAPDVRTRRYRGTIASPSAVQSGDYLFRSNHEYYNGTSLLVGGAFAFDNTNNANRTQFSVAVDIDGTGADPQGNNGQFKIDGNDGGAITFNNAYKFPTSDGSANQILQTNGSGVLSFTGSPTFTGLTVDTNTLYVDSSNNRVGIGTTSPGYQVEIENTGSNALLVLDRTDGASTFIEGGASNSVIGSVGANDVKIAYNSVPVVTFGSGGDITTSGDVTATDLTLSGNLTVGVTNYNSKEYVLYGSTTDATETEIFVGGTTNSRIPVASNTTIFYQVYIVARRTDATGESAGIHLKGVVDNFSGTVADVGDVYEVIVARDDSNYLVDARADDTNDAIGIHVTGVASKTISWTAIVKTHEVAQ